MVENKRRVFVLFLLFKVWILGWNTICITAATDPSDASALKIMYTSLGSPPQLTQWSATGDDPCGQSWKGVICSGQRVTELKLSGIGLSGSMGYQLSSLTTLTNFDLSNNNLEGDIPYNLPPNLERLNFANNRFTGVVPHSISQMKTLKYLNLGHNQLQGQLNDMFGQLPPLSTMDLSFNTLSGNLPQSFSSLSSLSSLYLQNNQFSGTIDVLANLPLDNLNIENNRFTGWIPDQLKNINLQQGGNTFSSGPAPPPPPGTPPAGKNSKHKSDSNENPTESGGGSKKSGIGGGGIAGILISLFFVGGMVAFFLVKRRRSRRSSLDVEKLNNQPFASHAASSNVLEIQPLQSSSPIDSFDTAFSKNLRPPPIDCHKSFDEKDFSKKPFVFKKAVKAHTHITSYSIADLQMATGSFNPENLLGEGTFGSVYRAQFDEGK